MPAPTSAHRPTSLSATATATGPPGARSRAKFQKRFLKTTPRPGAATTAWTRAWFPASCTPTGRSPIRSPPLPTSPPPSFASSACPPPLTWTASAGPGRPPPPPPPPAATRFLAYADKRPRDPCGDRRPRLSGRAPARLASDSGFSGKWAAQPPINLLLFVARAPSRPVWGQAPSPVRPSASSAGFRLWFFRKMGGPTANQSLALCSAGALATRVGTGALACPAERQLGWLPTLVFQEKGRPARQSIFCSLWRGRPRPRTGYQILGVNSSPCCPLRRIPLAPLPPGIPRWPPPLPSPPPAASTRSATLGTGNAPPHLHLPPMAVSPPRPGCPPPGSGCNKRTFRSG